MKSGEVGNDGDRSHRPKWLAQQKANHHDAITPGPLSDGVDRVLSLGFGLSPYIGRQHCTQQCSQSHEQGTVAGYVNQGPDDKKISVPVQSWGARRTTFLRSSLRQDRTLTRAHQAHGISVRGHDLRYSLREGGQILCNRLNHPSAQVA